MGVPALFRWLSQKYPKIISPVVEAQAQEIDGVKVPVDTTAPNPNGFEFDNLYLDMNGIVHPCSHPEDKEAPRTEEDMMLAIYEYTERVVNMVRPRKLLMIAVDGVAPRAKMNQQRSRRFRSAQEAKEKDEDKAELVKMLKSQNGGSLDEEQEESMNKKTWDSNAITPGTPFMFKLAASLRYWCSYKINTDPGWKDLKVLISDASVPGEGEHKIMEFIRSQRSSPEHDPNTRHVMYGLDADLIMLGLATHEPHFHILREDVFFQESKAKTCRICGQKGHFADQCRGEVKIKEGEFDEKDKVVGLKPFIWLHVSVLREYLQEEMYVQEQPFQFDLERALDDWVFLAFFVGNDFLPHLPSLDIRDGGIDTLLAIWRDNIPLMGGYLTKDGQVELARAQFILDGLAKQEDAIFKRRRQAEEKRDANNKRRKLEQDRRNDRQSRGGYNNSAKVDTSAPEGLPLWAPGQGEIPKDFKQITHDMAVNRGAIYKANIANKSAAAALKSQLLGSSGGNEADASEQPKVDGAPQETSLEQSPGSALGKRKADLLEQDDASTPGRNTPNSSGTPKPSEDEPPPDNVRLWEEGYADRYYEQKFGVEAKDIAFRNKVARAYVEGLCWVLLYYFQGCPSWNWYYPYHYAPFAADFVELDQLFVKFDKGKPFKPYEQLMGVLPAASSHAIPTPFRSLMSDPDSDILDFYPEEFPIDLNGKKMAWQAVVLLPFIDEKRLLDAMNKKYPLLSEDEVARNELGNDVLIFSDQHPLYEEVAANFYSKRQGAPKYKLDPAISKGLAGKVEKNPDWIPQGPLSFPFEGEAMPSLDEDRSISVFFQFPQSSHVHKSMLLRGVKLDPPSLDRSDIEATRGRARNSGRSFGGAPLQRGGGYNRNGGGGGRGGRIDYAPEPRPNPFAGLIQPGFVPPLHMGNAPEAWRGPPPQAYPPPHNGYGPPSQPPPPYGYNQGSPGYDSRSERPLPPGYGYNRLPQGNGYPYPR